MRHPEHNALQQAVGAEVVLERVGQQCGGCGEFDGVPVDTDKHCGVEDGLSRMNSAAALMRVSPWQGLDTEQWQRRRLPRSWPRSARRRGEARRYESNLWMQSLTSAESFNLKGLHHFDADKKRPHLLLCSLPMYTSSGPSVWTLRMHPRVGSLLEDGGDDEEGEEGLDAAPWNVRTVREPAGTTMLLMVHCVHTCPGLHLASSARVSRRIDR